MCTSYIIYNIFFYFVFSTSITEGIEFVEDTFVPEEPASVNVTVVESKSVTDTALRLLDLLEQKHDEDLRELCLDFSTIVHSLNRAHLLNGLGPRLKTSIIKTAEGFRNIKDVRQEIKLAKKVLTNPPQKYKGLISKLDGIYSNDIDSFVTLVKKFESFPDAVTSFEAVKPLVDALFTPFSQAYYTNNSLLYEINEHLKGNTDVSLDLPTQSVFIPQNLVDNQNNTEKHNNTGFKNTNSGFNASSQILNYIKTHKVGPFRAFANIAVDILQDIKYFNNGGRELFKEFQFVFPAIQKDGRLKGIGKRFINALTTYSIRVKDADDGLFKDTLNFFKSSLNEPPEDIRKILLQLDTIYTVDKLAEGLTLLYEYPKTKYTYNTVQRLFDIIFEPHYTKHKDIHVVLFNIDTAFSKRNLFNEFVGQNSREERDAGGFETETEVVNHHIHTTQGIPKEFIAGLYGGGAAYEGYYNPPPEAAVGPEEQPGGPMRPGQLGPEGGQPGGGMGPGLMGPEGGQPGGGMGPGLMGPEGGQPGGGMGPGLMGPLDRPFDTARPGGPVQAPFNANPEGIQQNPGVRGDASNQWGNTGPGSGRNPALNPAMGYTQVSRYTETPSRAQGFRQEGSQYPGFNPGKPPARVTPWVSQGYQGFNPDSPAQEMPGGYPLVSPFRLHPGLGREPTPAYQRPSDYRSFQYGHNFGDSPFREGRREMGRPRSRIQMLMRPRNTYNGGSVLPNDYNYYEPTYQRSGPENYRRFPQPYTAADQVGDEEPGEFDKNVAFLGMEL